MGLVVRRVVLVFTTLIVSFFSLVMIVFIARRWGFDPRDFHDGAKVFAPLTLATALSVMLVPIALTSAAQALLSRSGFVRARIRPPAPNLFWMGFIGGAMLKGLATAAWLIHSPEITLSFSTVSATFVEWAPYWLWFVFALVLNSLSEELVFRAFPLENLRTVFSPTTIVIVSGLLFAGMHLAIEEPDIWSFLYRLSFGILAGFIYRRTGSLWQIVCLHTGWNFMAWTISDSDWRLGTLIQTAGGIGHEETIWNSVILCLALFLVLLRGGNRKYGS